MTSPQAASTHVHEYVDVPDQLSDRNISTSETMSVIPLTLGTRRKPFDEVSTQSNACTHAHHTCSLCFVRVRSIECVFSDNVIVSDRFLNIICILNGNHRGNRDNYNGGRI